MQDGSGSFYWFSAILSSSSLGKTPFHKVSVLRRQLRQDLRKLYIKRNQMSGRLTNQEMNAFFFGHNDKWPGARGNETVRQIPCLEDKEQRPLMYFSKKIFEKKKLFEREQMLLHNECYFSY